MNILPGTLLFGMHPAYLIECCDKLRDDLRPFSLPDFSYIAGAAEAECKTVLDQMIREGFLDQGTDPAKPYVPNLKFNQLALANVSPGIPRKEADSLLSRLVEKAKEINANSEQYPCGVQCVVVFGSYLTEKAVLGDLDIGVATVNLWHVPGSGVKRPDPYARVFPDQKTICALRLRKPKLVSIHLLDEVRHLDTPFRLVFGELPPLRK